MLEGKITFDRMARWVLMVAVVITVIYLINLLGSVLLPFFVGWLLAYLLYPMVKFVQYRMHVPSRPLAIVVTLLVVRHCARRRVLFHYTADDRAVRASG